MPLPFFKHSIVVSNLDLTKLVPVNLSETQGFDVMAVASRGTVTSASSSLNPNAPLFVPMAYQQVEDFSPEWWSLIKSSAWFRDYWIRERYDAADDFADLLPDDAFDQYESDEFLELESELEGALNASSQKSDEVNEKDKEVATLKSIGMKQKSAFEKHIEKPPQIINTKLMSPRRIQQPR